MFVKYLLKDKMQRLKNYYEPYEFSFLKIKSQTVLILSYFRAPKMPIYSNQNSLTLNLNSNKEQHGSNTWKRRSLNFKTSVNNWTRNGSRKSNVSLTFWMNMNATNLRKKQKMKMSLKIAKITSVRGPWMQRCWWWRSRNGPISNQKEFLKEIKPKERL